MLPFLPHTVSGEVRVPPEQARALGADGVRDAIRAGLEAMGVRDFAPAPDGFTFTYRGGRRRREIGPVDAGGIRVVARGGGVWVAYRVSLRRVVVSLAMGTASVACLVSLRNRMLGLVLLLGVGGLLYVVQYADARVTYPRLFLDAVRDAAGRLPPAPPPTPPRAKPARKRSRLRHLLP